MACVGVLEIPLARLLAAVVALLLGSGLFVFPAGAVAVTRPRPSLRATSLVVTDVSLARSLRSSALRARRRVRTRRARGKRALTWAVAADGGLDAPESSLVSEDGVHREGPATLEAYCEGDDASHVRVGDKVDVNWKGYGALYPAKVSAKNSDGTINVHYDDGYTENNVDPDNVFFSEGRKPERKDDPACELTTLVAEVKEKILEAEQDIGLYLCSARAQEAGKTLQLHHAGDDGEHPDGDADEDGSGSKYTDVAISRNAPAPAAAPAPSPAAVNGTDAAAGSEESEVAEADAVVAEEERRVSSTTLVPPGDPRARIITKLKEEMEDLDEEMKTLKDDVKDNNNLMEKEAQEDSGAPGDGDGVEYLINEYRRGIGARKEELKELKERREQQEQELAAMGAQTVDLDDITHHTKDLADDLEKIKKKREQIEKQGKLDPELRVSIDGLLSTQKSLKEKAEVLVSSNERLKEATREEDVAAETGHGGEAAARRNEKDARRELVKAAEDMETELTIVGVEMKQLDTGVHPHGEKWWRYRYEHAFVESIMMILITILMLIWETIFKYLRRSVNKLSVDDPQGVDKRTDLQIMTGKQGTIYTHWLEFFTGELMTCLLVFLTVWVMAQFGAFNYLPLFLVGDDLMRLPKTGHEYWILALNIMVVLFFAVLLFFVLMFAVAHATYRSVVSWAAFELEDSAEANKSWWSRVSHRGNKSARRGSLTIAQDKNDYERLKHDFMEKVWESVAEGQDRESFEFFKYLRVNTRAVIDGMFEFGVLFWAPIIATFVVLMLLHRFLLIGYVRVMVFFLALLVCTFAVMIWIIRTVNLKVFDDEGADPSDIDSARGPSASPGPTTWPGHASRPMLRKQQTFAQQLTRTSSSKGVVTFLMHYNIFFLCYGAARSICQPWMWQLHFWPLVVVSCTTVVVAALFVFVLAPLIPTFAAAMALPPYTDAQNVKLMKEVARADPLRAKSFSSISASPASRGRLTIPQTG